MTDTQKNQPNQKPQGPQEGGKDGDNKSPARKSAA